MPVLVYGVDEYVWSVVSIVDCVVGNKVGDSVITVKVVFDSEVGFVWVAAEVTSDLGSVGVADDCKLLEVVASVEVAFVVSSVGVANEVKWLEVNASVEVAFVVSSVGVANEVSGWKLMLQLK